MPFNWGYDYPHTDFHELNLDWFNRKFQEIFAEWASLYATMTTWKDATTEELTTWKNGVVGDMTTWENNLLSTLNEWKNETEDDIDEWESDILEALNTWRERFDDDYDNLVQNLSTVDEAIDFKTLELESGGLYTDNGIEFPSSTTSRSKYIEVSPNSVYFIGYKNGSTKYITSVYFYTDNTQTSADNNNFISPATVVHLPQYEGLLPFTTPNSCNYIRLRINQALANVDDNIIIIGITDYIKSLKNRYYVFPKAIGSSATDYNSLKYAENLIPGDIVKTNGFRSENDNGGALYYVTNESLTANGINILALSGATKNVLYAVRIFDGSKVTLESLNFGSISINTINNVLSDNNIKDVYAKNLTFSTPIVLGDYNFYFDSLTNTGTGATIRINGNYKNHIVRGNTITASNGSGLSINTENGSVDDNKFEINAINVKEYGIYIHPIKGNGVGGNIYVINDIKSTNYGIYSEITASASDYDSTNNRWFYSWEGEEQFSIGNIKAADSTSNPTRGTAVVFRVAGVEETYDGVTYNVPKSGTITGITFWNLAVEYSKNGILLSTPVNQNLRDEIPMRRVAGVKSIKINNLRVREFDRTENFLQCYGYLLDVYINTTSPIMLNEWNPATGCSTLPVVIDSYVFNSNYLDPIGKTLCAKYYHGSQSQCVYIKECTEKPIIVTDDIDFADMLNTNSTLYMTKLFICDTSIIGEIKTIALKYYHDESAENIKFVLPKKTNGETVKLKVYFQNSNKYTYIENIDENSAHVFELSGYFKSNNEYHVLTDLGTIDADNI